MLADFYRSGQEESTNETDLLSTQQGRQFRRETRLEVISFSIVESSLPLVFPFAFPVTSFHTETVKEKEKENVLHKDCRGNSQECYSWK
jgi:hypothetical protein